MRLSFWRNLLGAGCLLALSACGSHVPDTGAHAGDYVGGSVPLDCAPFARALSGLRLSGPAADWWPQADGRYVRGRTPSIGERSGVPAISPLARWPRRGGVAGTRQTRNSRNASKLGAPPGQRGSAGDRRFSRERLVGGARLVAAGRTDGCQRLSSLWLHPARAAGDARPTDRCDATGHSRGAAGIAQPLRGVLAAIAHLHVGQLGVLRAVRLAWLRRIIAEAEAPRARLADRPAAGDDTAIGAWRRRNGPRRGCRRRRLRRSHRCHAWHHRLSRALPPSRGCWKAAAESVPRPDAARTVAARLSRSHHGEWATDVPADRAGAPCPRLHFSKRRAAGRSRRWTDPHPTASARRTIVSSAHSISWSPRWCNHKIR